MVKNDITVSYISSCVKLATNSTSTKYKAEIPTGISRVSEN